MKRYSEKLSTIFQKLLVAGLIISACGSLSFADEVRKTFVQQNQATGTRTYSFVQNETVETDDDLATTGSGTFNVFGKNNSTSIIDFKSHSGFNVTETRTNLNISNLTIQNASSDIASAIYYTAGTSSVTLTNIIFKNNSDISDTDALGGAIYSKSPLSVKTTSFIKNYAKANSSNAYGGAIYSESSATAESSSFTDNYVQSINGDAQGGAIYSKTSATIKNTSLANNHALANGGDAKGGAVYSENSTVATNTTMSDNYAQATDGNAYGGAIYGKSSTVLTNTSLTGNYAQATGSGEALGGAVYAEGNVNMITTGTNQNTKIEGNYTQDASGNKNNAIYMANGGSTLEINANSNGRIDIKDNINGANGYKVNISGDKTGTVGIFGSVQNNGKVSVSDVTVSFSDIDTTQNQTAADKTTNHRIDNLAIKNNVDFILDVDPANSKSDTLTSSNADEGTMKVSSINLLSTSEGEKTIQVLDHANNITLDIDQLKNKIATEVSDTMYNDTILIDPLAGVSDKDLVTLGTTTTANDSIVIKNTTRDVLYELVKNNGDYKYLNYNTDSEYNLTKDLEVLEEGHLFINYNPDDTPNLNHRVINANGHSMFKITRSFREVNLDNLTIKNASTTSNGSVMNLTINSSHFFMRNSSELTNNHSDGKGGAVYAENGAIIFENSSLTNNTSGDDGGAVYIGSLEVDSKITNTDFKNNESISGQGGAIYAVNNLTISANNGSSTFEGNIASGESNAIYVAAKDTTLTLDARNNGTINMNDKISGTNQKYNLNITGNSTGNVNINNNVENAKISAISGNLNLGKDDLLQGNDFIGAGGNLSLINNQIGETKFSNLSVTKTTNIGVDASLTDTKMDTITANSYGTISGNLNINKINLISDTENKTTIIPFANTELGNDRIRRNVSIPNNFKVSRVYKYIVSYDSNNGNFIFTRDNGGGGGGEFSPSVLAGSVGQQIAYANQLANYEYATYHSNTYMMLPKHDRIGMENKLANSDIDEFDNTMTYKNVQEEIKSIWVRPYSSFESIPLKNGPRVTSINYGILAGGDSDLINLAHGFKLVYGGYFGYNGNNYHYNGIHAVQQGGLIGATANIYKGNFFNTLTANVGWQINDSDTPYGSDLTNMLITGFADKFGYNFEIADGKVIIQPSMNMGYTFIGSFNYTTSNNIKIDTEPLHVMHFIPGLKIIGNTKNGWQPYAVVNVVCNFGGKSHYTADNIVLPSMSIDPYVEYGIGIQKRWADKYSGFAQATVRSGGRRGGALLFGFRYMLGQIAEKTANLLHADPVRKIAIFREKKDPQIVIEPIRKWRGDKKIAKGKDSKIRNMLKKTKQKLCFWYKTDVSAKMVEEVYPDGVIKPEVSNKKMKKQEEYTAPETIETITVVEKSVKLKKQFIEHKVAEKTMLELNNKSQPDIGSLKNLIDTEQEPVPSALITEAPLFKTDAILKRHKPSNKSLYINQNDYKDYSKPKSFNDYCFELINLKF